MQVWVVDMGEFVRPALGVHLDLSVDAMREVIGVRAKQQAAGSKNVQSLSDRLHGV